MSPEQAKGRPADKRSDVWAFGCVLYEMLTGRRAFEGEDISDTLAAILRGEPDWSALPADVTPPIRALLRRCVERDRKTRIPDISVVRFLMDDAGAASAASTTQPAPPAPRGRGRLAWAAAAVLLLTTIALGAWMYVGNAPVDVRMMRFSVSPPDGWRLTSNPAVTGIGGGSGGSPAPLTVSPDGRRVAFLANGTTGRSRLWVRALDTLTAQELPGTDGATMPFWSPDSESLAFYTDGKLKKIAVSGGPSVTLCDAASFRGGAWGRDGVIVFAPGTTSALQKVSSAGGVPTAATVLAKGESGHVRPAFLPDGRHFIYRAFGGGIYVGSLDSSDRTELFKTFDNATVRYSQGYLLFLREATLMAQPFDAGRLTLSGEPVPIAEQILSTGTSPPNGVFSVSDNGVLAYQTGTAAAAAQLVWLDRTGKLVANVGEPGLFSDLERFS